MPLPKYQSKQAVKGSRQLMGNLEMAVDDLPRGADISETLAEACRQSLTLLQAAAPKGMLTFI
jgi:hypothetical protein